MLRTSAPLIGALYVAKDVSVSFQTKLHLWWTWLQIAVRNAAEAQRARGGGAKPRSFESGDSANLSMEFECAMTAIAAVTFSMEALSKEVEGAGYKLDESLFSKQKKTNAGLFIAQRIIQAFGLSGAIVATLPSRLEELFHLRNDSVHFESEIRQGLHPHPSGTNTAYELTIYTLERSVEAVQVGYDIVTECTASAKQGAFQKPATSAANEMPSVLGMLQETIRHSGLRGIK